MASRELSILQTAYRDFFLGMLAEYEVNSPAALNYDQKKEFFTRIKVGWNLQKDKINQLGINKVQKTTKEKYAKIKVSRPSIALEQSNQSNIKSSISATFEKILSVKNIDQTNDLVIKFYPNQFFEQENAYSYPIVKMPQGGSLLKLPRKGRALGKGYKEIDFLRAIMDGIPNVEVADNLHLAIPFFNKPYEPDIVLIAKELNLYLDIEIDEPYDGYYRFPTHEIEKDDTRDLFFTESGWVVIRFTERQVHLQESDCIAYIQDVLNSIYLYKLEITSNINIEEQWTYSQSVHWQKEHYREKYLGIDKFGKQNRTQELIVELNDYDTIEQHLQRTKRHNNESSQDTIAFEDETHKYHHPKDQTGNAEYISVTTLIDRFFPFDIDRYIHGKAKREERSEMDVLEEFIKNRDESAEKGTELHEQIERFLNGQMNDYNTKEFTLFKKFHNEIIVSKGFEFIEAEKRILLEQYNVAGTVDALFKKPNSNDYIIVDWKRSKKLVVDGHPKKYGYNYALSELSNLDNSSYYKYALQQNIYKYILEKNYGMPISSMNLIVLHENYYNYFRIDLGDFSKEVAIILNSINHKI